MCATRPFIDLPERIEAAISGWQVPELPHRLGSIAQARGGAFPELACLIRERLARAQSLRYRSQLESEVAGWLYDFIRSNVKRGRVFDLGEVLQQGKADCLGYAKLFTLLGRLLGLDVGIVEVVVDNAGRYVPHTAVLVRLSNGRRRFVDLWYGSRNISHKRLGLQVKRDKQWQVEDLVIKDIDKQIEVSHLPDPLVDAITLYIRGNQYLNQQDFNDAIECYSQALRLYPDNARVLYNRAVAYENTGKRENAEADYATALRNETALMRVLATEHDEIISLISLDTRGVDNLAQQVYLLHRGFITGKKVPPAKIARRLGLSEAETIKILSSVEAKLASGST